MADIVEDDEVAITDVDKVLEEGAIELGLDNDTSPDYHPEKHTLSENDEDLEEGLEAAETGPKKKMKWNTSIQPEPVQGNSVDPNGNGQTVLWLSTAFKTLTLNDTLPGQIFQVHQDVLDQPSEDFKPLTNLKTTVATFKNPWFLSSSNPISRGIGGGGAKRHAAVGQILCHFGVLVGMGWFDQKNPKGWVKEGMTWVEVGAKIIGAKEVSESAILAAIAFLLPSDKNTHGLLGAEKATIR
ncbi:hypothetical protein BU17DRAFT_63406 [Hysterangium stoloniferum]|nr:hypothetical protein BU17DRAFT_63406 [Hysterangium stoloniferum]